MATTVSYAYTTVKPEFSAPYDSISGANDTNPSLVALSNGNFYMAAQWQNLTTPANTSIIGELFTGSGVDNFSSGGISGSISNFTNSDPAVTQLTNGSVLTTWTLPSGIHYYLSNPNYNGTIKIDTLLPGTDGDDFASDVAALKNGGFAVVKQDNLGATDQDADLLIYSANGTLITSAALGSNSSFDEQHPAVAVLSNGNIVVAYEKEQVDNTDTFGMSIEIFKQDGTRILNPTMFDAGGSNNLKPDVVALKDGGFAIAYQDDGYDQSGLTVAFFNSDGVLRGVQRADTDAATDGDPAITILANGNVAVTWTDGYNGLSNLNIAGAVFDTNTMQRVSISYAIENQAGNQTQSSIIGLADGTHVVAWTDANNAIEDGNGDANGAHVSLQIDAWTRTTSGTAANETFRGDGLRDVFNSNGGTDTFVYGRGGHTDTINGFVAGAGSSDQVLLPGFNGIHSFGDVALRASQSGANTVIDFGNGDILTLNNVNKLNLTADDFGFNVFDAASLKLSAFGASAGAGGWANDDVFHRTLADVNGDGRADIVGFGYDSTLVSLANNSGGFDTPIIGVSSFGYSAAGGNWSTDTQYHRTAADVNGDGKADLVGFGYGGTFVALATGSGHFADPILTLSGFGASAAAGGWSDNNLYHREVADVNGDGSADVIGFGYDGTYVALATGGGSFAAAHLASTTFGASAGAGGWSDDNIYHRELADVNGDGMADIVGFGSDTTYVALATGGGNFAAAIPGIAGFGSSDAGGSWSNQATYPRHLADINGDGRADIVGFGYYGTFTAYGNADGTFQTPQADIVSFGTSGPAGGWSSNTLYPRLLGDVDGGGAADIVGFGSDGAYVAHSNVNWIG